MNHSRDDLAYRLGSGDYGRISKGHPYCGSLPNYLVKLHNLNGGVTSAAPIAMAIGVQVSKKRLRWHHGGHERAVVVHQRYNAAKSA